MSKDVERFALLLDFYAPLLTERQQELMNGYYRDDLSLGEIAGEGGISRQAVHDQIKRAELQLMDCELRLGLVAEYNRQQTQLQQALALLQEIAHDTPYDPRLAEALRLLHEVSGPAAEAMEAGPEPEEDSGHGAV